MLHITAQRQ